MNNNNFIYCRAEEGAFAACMGQAPFSLTKRLWTADGVERPGAATFKAAGHAPEEGIWNYRMHVWKSKRQPHDA